MFLKHETVVRIAVLLGLVRCGVTYEGERNSACVCVCAPVRLSGGLIYWS
jgi:hypothetical protein